MRHAFWLAGPLVLGLIGSCSLFLDTESLQGGTGGTSSASSASAGASGASSGGAGGGGASVDGGDAGPRGVPIDMVAPALARAICDNLNACYVSATEVFIHDEDCQSLFTSVISGTVVAPVRQSVMRGLIAYDPVEAATCLSKLTQGTLRSPPECGDVNAIIEDCKRMLSSLAGEGRPCRHRFECDKGLFCDSSASCPGTCKRFAPMGAACAVDGDCDPVAGLYCHKAPDAGADVDGGTKGACQPFIGINATCTQNVDSCVPGALCIDKKCRRVSEIFTLAETFGCYGNGLLCERGLYCEFSSIPFFSAGTCVKEKAPLDPCHLSLPGECPKDTYCSAGAFNGPGGKCLVSPVENQKCATDFEQTLGLAAPCRAGLTCVAGICKPMRQLGEPCEIDSQCYSTACRTPEDGGPASCVPAGCP